MTNEEKIMIDTLISISKSLGKIANDIDVVKEVLLHDHRDKIKESRQPKNDSSKNLIDESNRIDMSTTKKFNMDKQGLEKHTMKENIRAILNGDYIN